MNLLYNANGEYGLDCWGAGLTITNGVLHRKGNINHTQLIPISPTDTYRLKFDYRCTSNDGSNYFYIALFPYDTNKTFIETVNTYKSNNTNTTLAKELKAGDTTVTLTSGANWDNSSTASRRYIGFCDNAAWGYARNTSYKSYSSISGNVLTLTSAYSGETKPAGTKVSNFYGGATYYYPYTANNSQIKSEWTHIDVTFTQESFSYGRSPFVAYFSFNTLGYYHTMEFRNIVIENISNPQERDYKNESPQLLPNGNVIGKIDECPLVRYIKDEINGNTANSSNHWVEIQAFNKAGNNVAYNKPTSIGGGVYTKNYITDGLTESNQYNYGTSPCIVDLGEVLKINKIKVWHYWYDGRTYYNHKVSVSVDGVNWSLVYSGEQAESKDGITVLLNGDKCKIPKFSTMVVNTINEV